MIRKAYWSGLASIILALAVVTGCSSNVATPPTTQIVTVAAGTCTAVNACTGPFQQNAPLNTAFPSLLSATVLSNGTPVAGATVTFTAVANNGAVGNFGANNATTATTNASGVATETATFTANGTVGTYLVVASTASTQLTGLFSMANTLVPAPISVSGGSLQSTTVGDQFANSLSVTVTNSTGTPVGAQLPVTFTVVPDPVTGASATFFDTLGLGSTTVLTNASGVATASPLIASSTVGGPYTVTVTTVDGDAATATIGNLYNTIMPAAITVSAGNNQSVPNGTPFAQFSVLVVDATTPVPNPVVGAVVTFTAPAFTITPGPPIVISAASGTFADSGTITTTAITDSTGTASPAIFTANGLAGGPYNVSATVVVKSGTSLSTNVSLTNQ